MPHDPGDGHVSAICMGRKCPRCRAEMGNGPVGEVCFSCQRKHYERLVNAGGVESPVNRDDWGTPDYILDAVRAALGGAIDLDPASSAWHNKRVGAGLYYDGRDHGDGLTDSWSVYTVFLNPPYSKGCVGPFVERFLTSANAEFREGVILVNVAPETQWQQRLLKRCAAQCWFAKRINFVHPVLKGGGNRYAQVAFYFGSRPDRFREAFAGLGVVR